MKHYETLIPQTFELNGRSVPQMLNTLLKFSWIFIILRKNKLLVHTNKLDVSQKRTTCLHISFLENFGQNCLRDD